MDLREYQLHLAAIGFGKKLPAAIYVYRGDGLSLGEELDQLVAQAAAVFQIGPEFNVLKFRTDDLKVSFLSYPDFFEDPHPALRHATAVDLVNGKVRHIDYAGNPNPPILHRKEAFLPANHPASTRFAALTEAEEAAGLYAHTATIGFKLNWEKLLAAKGLRYEGHCLVSGERGATSEEHPETNIAPVEQSPVVHRHKTAMVRYELSKPVRTLLEYGQLRPGATFLDYGCGQGADVGGLRNLGYAAEGWDPVHRPDGAKAEADVVNLGYVINVIEDPAERLETVVDAFRHTRRLLVVSALITETVDADTARAFGDGVLTKRNTFQKYYEQPELQQYLEDALETTAVPVSLGVFYMFRDPAEQQDFLAARTRRFVDWTQISARLGLGGPTTLWKSLYESNKELLDTFGKLVLALGRLPAPTDFPLLAEVCERLGSAKRALRAYVQGGGAEGVDWAEVRVRFCIGQPPRPRWQILCEEHKELLGAFWKLSLELGRLPEPEEFPQSAELREKIGSTHRAHKLFLQSGGETEWQAASERRRQDLLVYVALANLRRRVPFGHISATLRWDIRAFFGNYTRALEKGLELLYAAGDPGEIELACEDLKLGWQDERALYVHRSLLDQLPAVLRAYVGAATTLFGDVHQADVVKLHKASGKVTFLAYDDFKGKPLPELRSRTKVNLRTRWVQVYDHSAEGQLLYFKERFVGPADPGRKEMEAFSAKLRKLGLAPESVGLGPAKPDFVALLAARGLNENLNARRRAGAAPSAKRA